MASERTSFSVKDRVSHSLYGLGTVSQVNEHYTTIMFDENGSKKFLTRMVQLSRSDAPAPVKASARKKKKVAAAG